MAIIRYWWLPCKDGMKPLVADNHPYYQIYIKTNIYLFIYIYVFHGLSSCVKINRSSSITGGHFMIENTTFHQWFLVPAFLYKIKYIYIYIYKLYIYSYFLSLSLSLYIHIHRYICVRIYTPPSGLSTLAKELSAAASVMQSSSKELSTLVADRV